MKQTSILTEIVFNKRTPEQASENRVVNSILQVPGESAPQQPAMLEVDLADIIFGKG